MGKVFVSVDLFHFKGPLYLLNSVAQRTSMSSRINKNVDFGEGGGLYVIKYLLEVIV